VTPRCLARRALRGTNVRTFIAILIAALMATSPALARKASHHHSKGTVAKHQSEATAGPVVVPRHPDDIALDRKIGSICRGC
jgi:hypothetical protein